MDTRRTERRETNKPADHMRAANITATIWQNKGKGLDGKERTFTSVTLQRSYRDEKEMDADGQPTWKNTDSFGLGDIPRLIQVLGATYLKYGVNADNEE